MCHLQLHWGWDKRDLNLGLWVANILLEHQLCGIWLLFPFLNTALHCLQLRIQLSSWKGFRSSAVIDVTGAVSCTTFTQSLCESLLRLQLPFDYSLIISHKLRKTFVDSDCVCLLVVLGYWSSDRISLLNTRILKWKEVFLSLIMLVWT